MALTAKEMTDIANKAAADAIAAGLSQTDAEKIAEDVADQAQTAEEANKMIVDMIAAIKRVEAAPASSKAPAAAKVTPSKVDKEIEELLKVDRARKHFTVLNSTQVNGELYYIGETYVWDDAVVAKLGPNAKEVKG